MTGTLNKLYSKCKPGCDLLASPPLHTQAALMGLACAFRAEDGRRTHQSLLGLDDRLADVLEDIFQVRTSQFPSVLRFPTRVSYVYNVA